MNTTEKCIKTTISVEIEHEFPDGIDRDGVLLYLENIELPHGYIEGTFKLLSIDKVTRHVEVEPMEED